MELLRQRIVGGDSFIVQSFKAVGYSACMFDASDGYLAILVAPSDLLVVNVANAKKRMQISVVAKRLRFTCSDALSITCGMNKTHNAFVVAIFTATKSISVEVPVALLPKDDEEEYEEEEEDVAECEGDEKPPVDEEAKPEG